MKTDKREKAVLVKLTLQEYRTLKQRASEINMNVSEFVRNQTTK